MAAAAAGELAYSSNVEFLNDSVSELFKDIDIFSSDYARAVIRAGLSPSNYARLLVDLAEKGPNLARTDRACLAAVSMARPSSVPHRVTLLLGEAEGAPRSTRRWARVTAGIALSGIFARSQRAEEGQIKALHALATGDDQPFQLRVTIAQALGHLRLPLQMRASLMQSVRAN